MPTKHCAFINCTSDSRYPDPGNSVTFVPFAKPQADRQKCLRWIEASRRTDLFVDRITRYWYVCSKHFVGGNGPTPENPDPLPATLSKVPKRRFSRKPIKPVERPAFVKCELMIPDDMDVDIPEDEPTRETSMERRCEEESLEASDNNPEFVEIPKIEEALLPNDDDETHSAAWSAQRSVVREENPLQISTKNAECQTTISDSIYVRKLKKEITLLKKKVGSGYLRLETCREIVNKFEFYTGLSYEEFGVLWRFLGQPTAVSLQTCLTEKTTESNFWRYGNHNLSLPNQLFLTLVRLRRGFFVRDLSYRFGLSISQIRAITTMWIQLMYIQFKKLDIFPSAELTRRDGLPKAFQNIKNLRTIIDIFEIPVQRTKDDTRQQNTYSTYRYRDTAKFLIGVLPTGDCCFVSQRMNGRISDKKIVERSGFLQTLHEQDRILTYRDFNIMDDCKKIGCAALSCTFLKKKRPRLTNETQIRIKSFVRRIKAFQILRKSIPKTMLPMISQIVFVIAMLVNFQPLPE